MADVERFEATTLVRRPRVALLWAVLGLLFVLGLVSLALPGRFGSTPGLGWWLMGPALAAIRRRPKVEEVAVAASTDGLRIGDKLLARSSLSSALLKREGDRTFVQLKARGTFSSVDVQVRSDDEADRLCRALALDARSTTAEFAVTRTPIAAMVVLLLALMVGGFGAGIAAASHHAGAVFGVMGGGVLAVVALLVFAISRQTRLRVGADGILVKERFRRDRFYPHDAIRDVRTHGGAVVIDRSEGGPLQYTLAGAEHSKKRGAPDEAEAQARSVVWRIQQAREAFRALAHVAPQGAMVLGRGQRSAREWLGELRRVGEGASTTFRDALLTRDQLLAIVESTGAAAKERLAAAVALRQAVTSEEMPRLRIAAERCVQPELRERMVRVLDAPSDAQLVATLEEVEAEVSPGGEDAGARRHAAGR